MLLVIDNVVGNANIYSTKGNSVFDLENCLLIMNLTDKTIIFWCVNDECSFEVHEEEL